MAEASSGLPPSAPASGSGGGGVGATTSGPTAPSAPTLGTAPDGVQLSVQLSRFHLETLEGSATGDVDLRGLCLSVGNRDLLVDAHLSLKRGVRYGLVGRNGSGKSTLLRSIASGAFPGFPKDMRVLYVQQENVPGDERSALQTVIDAGSGRAACEAQISELEAALEVEEEAGDPQPLIDCVRGMLAARAADTAAEADRTAARRSRLRGKEAIRAALAAQAEAEQAQQRQVSHEEAAALVPQLLAELYEELDALGSAEEAALRAGDVLQGLGFSAEQAAAATSSLSGGWRMRVALGAALLAQPHLLLLDEPTNHLDIQSILWLQDYLSGRCEGQTVVLVSHDRAFLNAVAQETIVLQEAGLRYFVGTYDAYMEARAEASMHKERQVAAQDKQKTHLLDTIARAEKAAKESGDDKRLLQAASRRKKLDRVGCDKVDGKRFKLSYWAGYHATQRPQVQLDKPEEPVVLQLPPPEPLRQLGPVMQLRDITIAYASSTASSSSGSSGSKVASSTTALPPAAAAIQPQHQRPASAAAKAAATTSSSGRTKGGGAAAAPSSALGSGSGSGPGPRPPEPGSAGPSGRTVVVLAGVTMDIEQRARIGLVGLNGSGKTSLMRVMAGLLAPSAGAVTSPCPRLLVGHLDQHSGRRLLQEDGLVAGEGTSAFQAVRGHMPTMRDQDIYDYLAKFAVQGATASQPLASLSGGQRCRVALALTMLPRPHVLLLDEPTNHLDLLTVQALAAAVNAWEGAVVISSHDLRFLQDTCEQVWVVEGGEVRRQPQPEVPEAIKAYSDKLLRRIQKNALRQQQAKQQGASASGKPQAAAGGGGAGGKGATSGAGAGGSRPGGSGKATKAAAAGAGGGGGKGMQPAKPGR